MASHVKKEKQRFDSPVDTRYYDPPRSLSWLMTLLIISIVITPYVLAKLTIRTAAITHAH